MKFAFSLALNRSGTHQSILEGWSFWETGGFCKHKCSSLYNQAVELIYIVCQEVAVAPDVGTYYPNCTGQ